MSEQDARKDGRERQNREALIDQVVQEMRRVLDDGYGYGRYQAIGAEVLRSWVSRLREAP